MATPLNLSAAYGSCQCALSATVTLAQRGMKNFFFLKLCPKWVSVQSDKIDRGHQECTDGGMRVV